MGNVTVGDFTYAVYGDLDGATKYLNASVGDGADAWNALATDDLKSKYLVAAFRMLEEMTWQGAKTSDVQTQQWPRSGVVDAYGRAVDSSTVPTDVVSAEYELAAILVGDSTVTSQTQTGSNVRKVEAKGVGVEFFRPTNVPGVSPVLPVPVQRLVGQYLGGAASRPLSQSFSSQDPDCRSDFDDADSAFSDDAIMDRSGPLI